MPILILSAVMVLAAISVAVMVAAAISLAVMVSAAMFPARIVLTRISFVVTLCAAMWP